MRAIVNLRKDFVSSHLRSQIDALKDVLKTMETENSMDDGYIDENLKQVEKNLQRLRKLSKSQ